MPRATVELSHAMPDIVLIPFAVVGDKWRDEPWWTKWRDGAAGAVGVREICRPPMVRVRLADLGLDLNVRIAGPAHRFIARSTARPRQRLN